MFPSDVQEIESANEADLLTTQFIDKNEKRRRKHWLLSYILYLLYFCPRESLYLLTNVWNFALRIGGIQGNSKLFN